MKRWIAHFVGLNALARKRACFPKYVSVSIMKSRVYVERRSPKQHGNGSSEHKGSETEGDDMSLKEELLQDMKAAMKAKADGKTALSVIRMVRSAVRNKEIDEKIELDDAGVGAVIAKEMKQRKESLAEFEKAGRNDLISQVQAEISVLEKYMPKQLSIEEVRQLVQTVTAGKPDLKMGDVMKAVMPQVGGKADGRVVSQVVKEVLQNK
ncbi:YqeY-like protein [Veillonellaceae bacterium DNF00751]|jgi:hypothetical protein|nr:YqeY-like protein [Veillonellaceae bacterium DNF00751]